MSLVGLAHFIELTVLAVIFHTAGTVLVAQMPFEPE